MRLLRKHHEDQPRTEDEVEAPVCEHVTLVPNWDSAADIGRTDRVSVFRCDVCGAEFTPDQAAQLRATEASRVQRRIAS